MENKFKRLTGVVPFEVAEINDYVQFGEFAWQVIWVENGNKLLISKNCMQMDFEWEFAKDESSDANEFVESVLTDVLSGKDIDYAAEFDELKKYFSEWFYEKHFSKEDVMRIVPNSNRTVSGSPEYIFILNEEEVRKYIPHKKDRVATVNTAFADVKRPWLVRADGIAEYQVAVDIDGEIIKVPEGCVCDKFRPAIWVK